MFYQNLKIEDKKKFKRAFEHTFEELGVSNIVISICKEGFEKLQRAHDSIHEFILLAPLCLPSGEKVSWHSKSAFLMYQFEAFYSAHRSFLEALAGYYNVAYTLLRNTIELVLKGAFWECLAHRSFRDKAGVISKNKVRIGKDKITLIDWFKDLFERKPSIEDDLEVTSAGIFDKISPIPEDPDLRRLIPSIKKIIEQLSQWGILDPIEEPIERTYEIYSNFSADVHVIPHKTDIGRRLLEQKEPFEATVIPDELNKFSELLHRIIDIGIVIELNILYDWIEQNGNVKDKLKKRLSVIEKELQLHYASLKIRKLIERI